MKTRPSPEASLAPRAGYFSGHFSKVRPRRRPAAAVIAILSVCVGLGLLNACAGPPRMTRMACGACEGPDRFVRLQSDRDVARQAGRQDFSHPFQLPPKDWKRLLKSIQVRKLTAGFLLPGSPGPHMQAFADDEVEYLSVTLSKTFEQARPDELVVFGLTRRDSPEITEFITGEWFVEGPILHLILANYRNAVTMAGIKELLWDDPLHSNAGPFYELVPGDHQTLVKDEEDFGSLLSSPRLELSIGYQPLLLGEAAPHSKALKGPGSERTAPSPASPSLSIEERLQALKRWRDQELITDEDYRLKKQQLLDQF